jgi:hypothetical protein
MRCSPLFMYSDDIITEDCSLTNPNPFNIEININYCSALFQLYQGKDPLIVYENIKANIKSETIRKRLRSIENDKMVDVTVLKGHCLHAFGFAMKSMIKPRSFSEEMQFIIRDHPRSDTDTNAAIAGAMIGMKIGFAELMKDPVTKENWNILQNADTKNGEFPRPDEYHPKLLPQLVKEHLKILNK